MRWVITTSDPLYKVPIDHKEPAWGGREISFSRGGWLNGFCICTSALKMVQTAPLGDLVEPRPAVRNYCPPNRPGTPLTVAACRWRHAAGRRLWPDHRLIAIPGCTDIYGSCPSRSATYFEAHVKFRAPPGRFSIGTCIVGRRWSTSCYGCLAAPTPAGGYNITHDKCSGTSSASKRRATCPCWCSEAASTTCEAHAGCSHPYPNISLYVVRHWA